MVKANTDRERWCLEPVAETASPSRHAWRGGGSTPGSRSRKLAGHPLGPNLRVCYAHIPLIPQRYSPTVAAQTKRVNFEATPEQEARLDALKEAMQATSLKDAVLRASSVMLVLARELAGGKHLYLGERRESSERLVLPELELSNTWRWLVSRPHPWRRQLWVKGRKLLASQVWAEMRANQLTLEQAAEDFDLPSEAVEEILRYCEANAALIALEADEERRRLQDAGVPLAPAA